MPSVIARRFVVLVLCLVMGLDCIALQTIAWTTMVVTNTRQTASLAQAVTNTFDGNHPCNLCREINAAQHSQKTPATPPSPAKPDLICTTRIVQVISSFRDFDYAETAIHFFERANSPPVPPPRAALA